jgi:hypothetical protein
VLIALSATFAVACAGDETIADKDGGTDGTDGSDGGDGGDGADGGDGGDGGGDGGTDAFPDAEVIALGDPDEVLADEAIGEAGERDMYAFQVEEGDFVTVATLAYALTGETTFDTVIQLYNSDGDEIAENDDMPYRFYETDSVVVFRAEYSGTYYAEVLEWGDWDGAGASGGSGYDYELHAWVVNTEELEPNDDGTLAAESYNAWFDGGGEYLGGSDAIEGGDNLPGYFMQNALSPGSFDFYGALDSADDVDIWFISTGTDDRETPDDHFFVQIGQYPGMPTNLTPDWTLYDAEGAVVASTADTVIGTGYTTLYDSGVLVSVPVESYLTLVVQNTGTTYDVGSYYAGIVSMYYGSLLDQVESKTGETITSGTTTEFVESEATPGFFYTRLGGTLTFEDELDAWTIRASDCGGFDGRMMNFAVDAANYGSLLDPKLTVYDEDGTTVLAEETGNLTGTAEGDPWVVDFALPAGSEKIYVVIEAESMDSADTANFYYAFPYVYDPE